jgi:hypothetical protein
MVIFLWYLIGEMVSLHPHRLLVLLNSRPIFLSEDHIELHLRLWRFFGQEGKTSRFQNIAGGQQFCLPSPIEPKFVLLKASDRWLLRILY